MINKILLNSNNLMGGVSNQVKIKVGVKNADPFGYRAGFIAEEGDTDPLGECQPREVMLANQYLVEIKQLTSYDMGVAANTIQFINLSETKNKLSGECFIEKENEPNIVYYLNLADFSEYEGVYHNTPIFGDMLFSSAEKDKEILITFHSEPPENSEIIEI